MAILLKELDALLETRFCVRVVLKLAVNLGAHDEVLFASLAVPRVTNRSCWQPSG
jgi:hypothetical protein